MLTRIRFVALLPSHQRPAHQPRLSGFASRLMGFLAKLLVVPRTFHRCPDSAPMPGARTAVPSYRLASRRRRATRASQSRYCRAAPFGPRRPVSSAIRHADSVPNDTPPRPKSFLEKTLTRAKPPHATTPPPATASLPKRTFAKPLAVLLLASLLTACDPESTQELHVFAAASLREAIVDIADAFQRAHPDVQVVSNFAGSQTLRLQIESGARADLFVSANPDHLNALHRAGLLLAPPTVVATNELVLAVPAGNPASVSGIAALAQPGRRVVMAAESVPAGAYARRMLARHAAATDRPELVDAVLQRVISFETNVRQVAAKLELGEADAGFVYRTDVQASDGRLQVIETPPQVQVTARYPAGVLRDAPSPALAQRFLTYLRSPEAQTILARHGFAPAA